MYKYKDYNYSLEEVQDAADKEKLSIDEYIKEFNIQKTDPDPDEEGKETPSQETMDATVEVSDTASKSETSSLELANPKLTNFEAYENFVSTPSKVTPEGQIELRQRKREDGSEEIFDPVELEEVVVTGEKIETDAADALVKLEIEDYRSPAEKLVKRLAEGTAPQDPATMSTARSIYNTTINALNQLSSVDEKAEFLGAFISSDIDLIYNIFGEKAGEKILKENQKRLSKASKRFDEINSYSLPTIGFTDIPERKGFTGKLGGGVAGALNALSAFGTSIAISAPTFGVGLASDMIAGSVKTFNDNKAARLGISFDELIKQGKGDLFVPAALGVFGYGLERAGIKGVSNSINAMSNPAKKGLYSLLNAGGKEGTTEYLQGGVEVFNEALGQGKNIDEAGNVVFNYLTSKEGFENLLQGAFGGVGMSAGGRFVKAASAIKTPAENQEIANLVTEYSSLEDQKYKRSLTQEEKNIINKAQDNIKTQLTAQVKKNNVLVASMNENQINNINNNLDLIRSIQSQERSINESGNLSEEAKASALNQLQKDKKLAQDQVFNERNQAERRAANINKIKQLAETEKNLEIKDFATTEEVKQYLKENNIAKGQTKKAANQQGFFVQRPGEKDLIIINRQQSNKDNAVNVAAHEYLHYILSKMIAKDSEAANRLGKSLDQYLNKIDSEQIESSQFKQRLEQYKNLPEAERNEEVLALFSDALAQGDLKFDTNIFTNIGDTTRRFFQDLGVGVKFNKGRDVFNFIRDYNKSVEEARLTEAQRKLIEADNSAAVEQAETVVKESRSEEASIKVQELYEQKGVNAAVEIIEQFKPITNKIVEQRKNAPGFDRQLLTDEIETGAGGILDLIQAYDPASNVPLAAYINKFLPVRAITASRRVLEEEFVGDITEAPQVAAEAAPEAEIEVAETKPAERLIEVKNKFLSPEDRTAFEENIASRINELAPDEFTFKKLPNWGKEDLAKELNIPLKKFEGSSNFTQAELGRLLTWIETNVSDIRRALPGAAVLEGASVPESLIGTATGVPNNLLKNINLYERLTRGTKDAGLVPYRKLKGIDNSSILKAVNIVDGRQMAGPRDKAAQTAKGIFNMMAKVMTNQEIRKQLQAKPRPDITTKETESARAGGVESRLLFSRSAELQTLNSLNIGGDNNNLLSVKYSKSSRDAYEKILIGKRPELRDASEQVDNLFKWVDTLDIPENKKSKYEKLALFYMGNGNLILPEDGYKVEDAIKVAAKNKLDPFSYKNPNELLEKFAGDIPTKKINPDNLSTFSNKRELNDGITIYEIEDSRAGQSDVRKIIDSNWGVKANPWCLAALIDGNLDQAWEYWERYSGKKQIAFQNNKLLAFNAFDQYNPLADPRWYDRMDKPTEGLVFYKKTNDPRGLKLKLELNTENNSTKQIGYEVGSPKSNFYQVYNRNKELTKEIKRTATKETFFDDVRKSDTIDQWQSGIEEAKFEMFFYKPVENGVIEEDPIDYDEAEEAMDNGDLWFWDKRTAILTIDPNTKKDRYGNRRSTNSKYIYENNNEKYIVEAKSGGKSGYIVEYKELNGVKFLTGRDIIKKYLDPTARPPKFAYDLENIAKLIGTTYNQLLGEIQDTAFLLDSNNKPIIPAKFPFLTINNKGEFEAESINEISDEIDNQSATPSPRIKYSISFDYDFTKPDGGIQYQKQKALFIKQNEIFQEVFGSIEKQRGSVRGSHIITAKAFFEGHDTMSADEKAVAQKETAEIKEKAIEYKVQSGAKSLLEPGDSAYGSPQSKFGRTPKALEKSIADGVVEKENKKNVRIFNEMWKNRIYDLLESNPEMIDYIETFLELSNNDLSHPQRGGAELTAFDPNAKEEKVQIKIEGKSYNPKTNKFEEGVIKEVIKTLEYEHAKPSNIVRKELLKEAKRLIKKGKNKTPEEKVKLKAQFGEFVDNARKNYALWAVAYNDARKLDKANLAHKMPEGETILWKRYFNKLVAKYGGIDPKKLFTIIGKEVGPSVADTFGIKNDKGELTEFGENQLKLSKSISKAEIKNNKELPKKFQLPKDSTNEQVLAKMQELDNEANEARIKYSKSQDLNEDFNNIIEAKTGIATYKRFSPAKAQVRGASKGKFNFFIPPSAEDFTGLLYKTLAKGKVGDTQMQWYKDNLLDPYARAMNDISAARVAMFEDYKALKNDLEIIPKDLKKKSVDEYTREQAVRVYIWNDQGNNVPGLFKTDQKDLVDYVNKDSELKLFAEQLIAIQKNDEYSAPKEGWLAGNITTDLLEGVNSIKRKKYLEQWQTNVDLIFSEENMNKLEAAFGKPYRKALENILQRMKTGRNKPFRTDTLAGRVTDWLNNSVGAIMFFNTRSAVLQTISSINFVNWSDNNIYQAGKAFANQPQYWKDFKFLFNSDFLMERRGGSRFNVAESDIADAAKKGGARGVISKILQAGFLPTQMADSFAIASGGATFYRNRIKSYIKEGLTEAEAQEKAFLDFREIAEESQQSSRPDRISAQQAGALGRVVLAFANTPAQYARLTKKAASDLINRRGDAKTNFSKLLYYGFVQNLIFNMLQQATFLLAFGDEDEDEKKKEKAYLSTINGMADGLLRGMGIQGAAISTIKNVLIKISKEAADPVSDVLDFSPPISSKYGKLQRAYRIYKWNKEEIKEKGFSLDNPAYEAAANVISASVNVPLDRVVKKVNNVVDATQENITPLERAMLAAGWSEWELGIQKPKKKKKKKTRSSRRGTGRSNNRSSNRR